MTNDWKSFYQSRVNSGYQDKFEQNYAPFLEFITEQTKYSKYIIEMGCGIGSVSKALLKQGYTCSGFDLSPDMVELANTNVGANLFRQGDIFKEQLPVDIIGVSHGVLEHFSDEQIQQICEANKYSIHYVPLDKYVIPSFGDERLLPYQHWLDLVQPRDWFLFNKGHDLCFQV